MSCTRSCLLFTGVIVAVLAGCGEYVLEPTRWQSNYNGVKQTIDVPLSVQCSASVDASPESKVLLHLEVTNISQSPCNLCYKNPQSDFLITVFDKDGHIVEETSEGKRYQGIARSIHDFKAIFVSSVAITLEPRQAKTFEIELGRLFKITARGRYCVIVRKILIVKDVPMAVGASAEFSIGSPQIIKSEKGDK